MKLYTEKKENKMRKVEPKRLVMISNTFFSGDKNHINKEVNQQKMKSKFIKDMGKNVELPMMPAPLSHTIINKS